MWDTGKKNLGDNEEEAEEKSATTLWKREQTLRISLFSINQPYILNSQMVTEKSMWVKFLVGPALPIKTILILSIHLISYIINKNQSVIIV